MTHAPSQYTNGTHYAVTGSPSPGHYTFGNVPDSLTNGSYGGGSSGNGVPGEGDHSDCSGAISTSLTWVPATGQTLTSDPPPSQGIIMQTCSVSVGLGRPGGSGSYNDGLGQSGTASFNPPTSTGGSVSGTTYLVHPGGATVSLPSFSASANVTNAPSSANLSYTATIYPVLVTPSGAIKDSGGNWSILVGQGCTGFITAGPATFSNFQWSISGDTFKSFATGNTIATMLSPSHPYGRVNYLQALDLTGPSPQWFWKNGGKSGTPQTVSCSATATINGVTVGTVTGTAMVNVWLPYFYFDPHAQGAHLVGASVPNVLLSGDMTWIGSVGTPYLFVSACGGYGIWQYTQLCDIAVVLKDPLPWYVSNTNGSVLDAEFNYSSKESPPSPWPADSTSNALDPQSSGDAPDVALHYWANNLYTGTWDTYMMYQPPGGTVSWVPLNKCEWTMNCSFNLINGVYSPNPPGTLTVTSDTPSSEFPVWEDYFPDTNP